MLINNAGTYGPDDQSLDAAEWASWIRAFETNVLGSFFLTSVVLVGLQAKGGSTVVMITSRVGSIALASGERYAYRTTKAAANMMVKSLACDLAEKNVIVIAMHPVGFGPVWEGAKRQYCQLRA